MKDSGVEWIGKVPENWEIKKIKYDFDIRSGKTLQSSVENEDEIPVKYITTSNVLWEKIDLNNLPTMWANKNEIRKYGVKNGDLLVCEGGEGGRSAVLEKIEMDCITQNHVHIVRPKNNQNTKFLMYVLESIKNSKWFEAITARVTISNLPNLTLANTRIPFPSSGEQNNVVKFLEIETSKIDSYSEKYQKMANLLKEKAKIVVNQAVTKGLEPSVLMKDSKVKAIGLIPKKYHIKQLKHVVLEMISGPFGSSLKKEEYSKNGYRVYGQEQVIPANFSIGDYYIPKEKFQTMKRFQVFPNDVLISCVGTFGKIALVPENIEKGIINPRLIKLTPNPKICFPKFLVEYLKSSSCYSQLEESSRGGTMDIINLEILSKLFIPIPPLNEQKNIVSFVENEISKINKIISKCNHKIEKLREFRNSLISSATTGKIDLR